MNAQRSEPPFVDPDDFNPMVERRERVDQPQFSLEGARDRFGLESVVWKAEDVKVADGS